LKRFDRGAAVDKCTVTNPNVTTLLCPACDATANVSGQPFVSEWALACHMAGKIQGGDRLHRGWARKFAPQTDLALKGSRLGEELSLPIHEVLKTQKPRQAPLTIPAPPSLVEHLKTIEVQLHSHIKRRLQERYGTENEAWWFDGIPEAIRVECAQRRERDRARQEAFNYTYLIDLKTVIEKNWPIFEPDFAKIRALASSKKGFLDQITRLNEVRNRHSHPPRSPKPDSKVAVEDHDYVSKMAACVAGFCG
jgi:hypothetical protein